jgi:hypothetical protein
MHKQMKIKICSVVIIALVSGFLGGMAMGYQGVFADKLSFLVKNAEGEVSIEDSLTAEQVEEKIINYIKEEFNIPEISLATTSTTFEKGVYKLNFKIEDTDIPPVYATKDGNLFFPEAKKIMSPEEKKEIACQSVRKTEQPMLEAFVMSYCPYGTQMQRVINEIVKNIPELKNNIKIRYIGQIEDNQITSMHGEEEAQENLTQICLREEQGDKFYPYLSCFLKKGESNSCLIESGVNKEELDSCKQENSRGLTYAQKDFDLNIEYQASGSPTLVLNGEKASEFDFGGRAAEAVKSLLCCGFETQSQVCETILTQEEAASGFSETYGSGSSSSGTCQ